MIELNNENFEAEVLKSKDAVLVDFWGTTCEPCNALMPEVHKLADKYGDKLKMCKLNTNDNRKLAISQRVLGLPTFVVYRNGERIKSISGAENCTPASIEDLIKEFI